MTLQEFQEKYYLHDSFIESLSYDNAHSTLILQINFAFWMQPNHIDDEPENGLIEVTFHNVSKYYCENGNPTDDFVGILNTAIDDESFTINLLDDETEKFIVLKIFASSVTVKKL